MKNELAGAEHDQRADVLAVHETCQVAGLPAAAGVGDGDLARVDELLRGPIQVAGLRTGGTCTAERESCGDQGEEDKGARRQP